MKEQIIAALNAAGVKTEGLTDTQALSAYNSVLKKPVEDELSAEKAKSKKLEDEKKAVENAERDALAAELATNSQFTVDDLKLFSLARLKEFKGNAAAAPVVVGNSGQKSPADEFAGYDLNKL